jgi:membrane dipeptidase
MFFAAFVPNGDDEKRPAKEALELIDEIYRQVEMYPALAKMAYSPNDIVQIHREGKRAILIGMENGGPLEGSLRLLRDFYRLGARYITLTHNNNNNICDSSTAEQPKWNGLSPFGKEVVKEMNRLGMLIDVSHVSDKTFWDVIRESEAPVFASHSCSRTICDVPRNMTDDMIRALANKGGVIQVNFYSNFVDPEYSRLAEEFEKKMSPEFKKLRETYKNDRKAYWLEVTKIWKAQGPAAPGIESLMKQIDYVVKLVGVDYVGLGSDFDGASSYPVGLENVTGYPLITYHLLKRGYKKEDIKKILGGNFLRVFGSVIQTSEQIKRRMNK